MDRGGDLVRKELQRRTSVLFSITLLLALSLTFSAGAQTTITFGTWYGSSNLELLEEIIADFEALHPEYNVEILAIGGGPSALMERVMVQAAGGAPIDVTMVQHDIRTDVFNSGIFLDLAPLLARDLDVGLYFPELLRFWNANDVPAASGQVALPLVSYAQALYFSVDLFEQAGLESPISLHERGVWSREAFVDAARKITRPEREIYGFTQNPDWITDILIHNAGGRMYTPEADRTLITDPLVAQTVQWQADLINVHEISVWDTWDHQAFATGRGGMFITAAWMTDILNQTSVAYDVAPIFYTGEPRPHHQPSGDGVAILAGSSNQEGAWKLVKYLLDREAQIRLASIGIPIHGDVAKDPLVYGGRHERPSNLQAFVYELAEKTASFYPPGIPGEVGGLIWSATQRVYNGEAPAQVAFAEVEEAINTLLATWHAQK